MPLLLLLVACTGGKDTGDTATEVDDRPGVLLLTFAMDDDYIAYMEEDPGRRR